MLSLQHQLFILFTSSESAQTALPNNATRRELLQSRVLTWVAYHNNCHVVSNILTERESSLSTCDANMCDVSGIGEVYLQVVCLALLGPATLSSAVCLLSLLRVGQACTMTARALAISVRHALDKFHHHSLATTAESG